MINQYFEQQEKKRQLQFIKDNQDKYINKLKQSKNTVNLVLKLI